MALGLLRTGARVTMMDAWPQLGAQSVMPEQLRG
jgi:hypothetical protein